ncbi:MAG: DUF2442 domain-containing protein [Armatimonadetes bacterium]|nr:DUF2442 domain-containing protein [Armatimonadota bacterium]
MHRVASVEPIENCRLRISFTDGLVGEVDLSEMVGKGVFEVLANPDEFAKVYVDEETHTVAWPGGIDLCPDSLYQDVLSQQKAA